MNTFLITIDGPSGVGKSTLAKRLADHLNIAYLDTGAMYRTLALKFGANAADISSEKLKEQCSSVVFSLRKKENGYILCCDDTEIGSEIRTEKAGRLASVFAKLPVVRESLHEAQRQIASSCPLVAEGRDMGTRVFPDAPVKFFLDASPEVRAKRRFDELKEKNKLQGDTFESILEAMRQRDKQDREREIDPLRPAKDAVIVDTSQKNIDEVFEELLSVVKSFPAEDTVRKQTRLYTVSASLFNDNNTILRIDGKNPVTAENAATLIRDFLEKVQKEVKGEMEISCSMEIHPWTQSGIPSDSSHEK